MLRYQPIEDQRDFADCVELHEEQNSASSESSGDEFEGNFELMGSTC